MADRRKVSRRKFLLDSSKLATASALMSFGFDLSSGHAIAERKLKLALVGTGSRGTSMWGKNLFQPYRDYVELVALCDINYKRLEVAKKSIQTNVSTFTADEFDRMIKETKPDAVIVTTVDSFHEKYIVRAMELGCDVISEKPIATEAEQCQRIIDTEQKTGKRVLVTFNVRYMRESEQMKEIISSGELGNIISIDYHEYLDTQHGASYFRRWHRKMAYSGSLLVTKSTHHFDLINWLIDSEPKDVHAYGKLAFYGRNNSFRGRNCRTCVFKDKCKFYWDITTSEHDMQLYVACEDVDGYLRDGCVWDNEIDIYDTSTVQVRYDNDTLLTYTLNAFLPYEGQCICFSGEKGRLDVRLYYRQPWQINFDVDLRLSKVFGESKNWQITAEKEGHGGADSKLKDMIFKPNQQDPMGKRAGSRAGVMSSLIGVAARKSIENGERINIADLINLPRTWDWNPPNVKS